LTNNGLNLRFPGKNPFPEHSPGEPMVKVYRTEADPNRRLEVGTGVVPREGVKGANKMLFINVNPKNADRTFEFMQQSKQRETKELRGTKNVNGFLANGQTIRTVEIPEKLANDMLKAATPFQKGLDVQNVDITKAHNQIGIRGEFLDKFKAAAAQPGAVKEGTASVRRPNSEFILPSTVERLTALHEENNNDRRNNQRRNNNNNNNNNNKNRQVGPQWNNGRRTFSNTMNTGQGLDLSASAIILNQQNKVASSGGGLNNNNNGHQSVGGNPGSLQRIWESSQRNKPNTWTDSNISRLPTIGTAPKPLTSGTASKPSMSGTASKPTGSRKG